MTEPARPHRTPLRSGRSRRRWHAGGFGLALLVAGCGGTTDNAGTSTSAAASSPTSSASLPAGSGGLTYRLSTVVGPDGLPLTPPPGTVPIAPDALTGAQCPAGLAIAVAGPHSGDLAVIGGAARNGAQLAVEEFTAANPGCPVILKPFDTGSRSATAVAAEMAADASVIAVIGPSTSDEVMATGTTFAQAGLAAMSPSATLDGLTDRGFSTFLRGLADDGHVATATPAWILAQPDVTTVCVAHAGPPIDVAVQLAPLVTAAFGAAAQPACDAELFYQQDLTPVVESIVAAQPQAVYVLTVMPQAAEFVQKLRSAGLDVPVYLSDLAYPVDYLAEVGDAGRNSVIVCACQLPTPEFAATYAAEFGTDAPAMWAPEGYELATIALGGIASGTAADRASMLQYLRNFDGWGSGRHYQWTSTGDMTTPATFLYDVVTAG